MDAGATDCQGNEASGLLNLSVALLDRPLAELIQKFIEPEWWPYPESIHS
jgi:hypothetical protein